jgi:hypothetical protein
VIEALREVRSIGRIGGAETRQFRCYLEIVIGQYRDEFSEDARRRNSKAVEQ